MSEYSTPSNKPRAERQKQADFTSLLCGHTDSELSRSDSLLSKHFRVIESNKTQCALAKGIETLCFDTPINKIDASNMDSPTIDPLHSSKSPGSMELTPPPTPKTQTVERFQPVNPQLQRPVFIHRRRSSSDFCFDIKNIEFDTTDAQLLGTGAWSKVYKLNSTVPLSVYTSNGSFGSPPSTPPIVAQGGNSLLTPPTTPQKPGASFSLPRALAIKVATRSDALSVFESEAHILSYLQQASPAASEAHVIPFYGLSVRSRALIFQCANGGTLEDLILATSSRSPEETLALFEIIAPQLVAGLAFLHRSGIVHADIKPANILLDEDSSASSSHNLRARFADFSASFRVAIDGDATPLDSAAQLKAASSAAGGTWAYMAPEQLVRDPALSTPTFASDVYSLGITLLSLLIGGDPFAPVSANLFMLREAVKMGDALNFAMREYEYERRLEAVEGVWKRHGREGRVLSLFKGVLRKKREERVSAREWATRVEGMFSL